MCLSRYPVLLALVLSPCLPLMAQMPVPSADQLDTAIAQAIASLPLVAADEDEEAAAHPVELEYRALPTDPAELIRSQVPAIPGGADPDVLVRQYLPQAMPFVQKHMRDLGVLRSTVPLKVGREEIPAGEHKIGFLCDDEAYRPVALVVWSDALEEDIVVKLRSKRSRDETFPELKLALEGSRKDFTLVVGWEATISTSKKDFRPLADD